MAPEKKLSKKMPSEKERQEQTLFELFF